MKRLNSIVSKYGNYISNKNISPEKDGAIFKFKKTGNDFTFTFYDGGYFLKSIADTSRFIGFTLHEVLPKKNVMILEPYYQRSWNGESIIYDSRSDFETRRILVYFEPIFNNEEVIEVCAYIIDVSKWRPEERMINILALDGTVKYVSDKWVDISGFMRDEIIDKSIFPLITPEYLQEISKIQMKVVETKTAQYVYYNGYHRNKSILDLFAVAFPVVYNNAVKFVVVLHM